jgi:hypothetical protein
MRDDLLNKLKDSRESNFRPEFLNRIDDIIVFHTLTEEQIRAIVDMMLATVSRQLAEKEIRLQVTDAAKDFLGKEGYKEEYGARQLRRVIQNRVEDRLSEAVLRGGFKTFERIYEIKTTIKTPGVMDDIIKSIKEIPEKRAAEKSTDKYRVVPEIKGIDSKGDSLTIYATESIKYELEKIIKEALEEKGKGKATKKAKVVEESKVTENAYVSEVVVDVADGEITIDSNDEFSLPNVAVSAKAR